jgi:antirestriction protein
MQVNSQQKFQKIVNKFAKNLLQTYLAGIALQEPVFTSKDAINTLHNICLCSKCDGSTLYVCCCHKEERDFSSINEWMIDVMNEVIQDNPELASMRIFNITTTSTPETLPQCFSGFKVIKGGIPNA